MLKKLRSRVLERVSFSVLGESLPLGSFPKDTSLLCPTVGWFIRTCEVEIDILLGEKGDWFAWLFFGYR